MAEHRFTLVRTGTLTPERLAIQFLRLSLDGPSTVDGTSTIIGTEVYEHYLVRNPDSNDTMTRSWKEMAPGGIQQCSARILMSSSP